jgi:hypothetical protein
MSSEGAKIGYVVGTIAMVFGLICLQMPSPRDDPRLSVVIFEIIIFSFAMAFLIMPAMHLYRIASKGTDLVILLGLAIEA